MTDLAARLPHLLPRIIDWAQAQSQAILRLGIQLDETSLALARAVEVSHPERIRIWTVPEIPAPQDAELRQLAFEQNLIGPGTAGMTLGYGIFMVEGSSSSRLLCHECRHVYQYEAAGSIAAFLPLYLQQIAEFGYEHSPFEVDARAWEWRGLARSRK